MQAALIATVAVLHLPIEHSMSVWVSPLVPPGLGSMIETVRRVPLNCCEPSGTIGNLSDTCNSEEKACTNARARAQRNAGADGTRKTSLDDDYFARLKVTTTKPPIRGCKLYVNSSAVSETIVKVPVPSWFANVLASI
jgi:hypothetical protein